MLLFVYPALLLLVVIMISSKGLYDLVYFSALVLPQARAVNEQYTILDQEKAPQIPNSLYQVPSSTYPDF